MQKAVLAFLGAVALFAYLSLFYTGWEPLWGSGDMASNEHLGFFFTRILHFFPFPHASYVTDWVGYPYPVLSALQGWFFERELWMGAWDFLFGWGPWIPLYLTISLLLQAIGSYLLLRPFGERRAAMLSFALCFLNFYVRHRYPAATATVAVHWAVLNVLCDYRLVRKWESGFSVHPNEVALRLLLLLLSLGMELGYVAGIGLSSFVLCFLYLGVRAARDAGLRKRIRGSLKRPSLGWLVAILALGWLYVPLCLQLLLIFRQFPHLEAGSFWSNPLRLLIPWFPHINPVTLSEKMRDTSEGVGALSVGWTFLIPGVAGTFFAWRGKKKYLLPFGIFFALLILHHPKLLPLLKVFPWFGQMRVSGRVSVILPTLLALFAMEIPFRIEKPFYRLVFAFGVLLAGVESATAYLGITPLKPLHPTADFYRYMETVRDTPGEAVFDWPFCIHGGNGVPEGLCPGGEEAIANFALQRFHRKKVPGFYFGRVTESLVEPYFERGWQYALSDPCLERGNFESLERFLRGHDFAGINLYEKYLPSGCLERFVERFGPIRASTEVPDSGRVSFIALEKHETKTPAATLFAPAVDFGKWDAFESEEAVFVTGIEKASEEGNQAIRKVSRPHASVRFFRREASTLLLRFVLGSLYEDQSYQIRLNGTVLFSKERLRSEVIPLAARAGWNELRFEFEKTGDWKDVFALYRQREGILGFVRFLRLQAFYKRHRHSPAYFSELSLAQEA